MRLIKGLYALAAVAMLSVPVQASASQAAGPLAEHELGAMSVQELLAVEIFSLGKKKQSLSDSAAAVYILSNEDIRRSGATTIPELLRIVPGVEAARIDAHAWAITARGFNDRSANKLLVLIDGRSVYTPLFAGVDWEAQDTFLEDIDRIEVIRGPGGTVWGANAVNGVINIITKHSAATQGILAEAGGGSHIRHFEGLRYGGEAGENATFRAYAKYFDRGSYDFDQTVNPGAADTFHQGRGGFRFDWDLTGIDSLIVSGDAFSFTSESANSGPLPTFPYQNTGSGKQEFSGGHVLSEWARDLSDRGDFSVKSYYDRTDRDSRGGFTETRDTFDVEVRRRSKELQGHDLVYGAGYRLTHDDLSNDFQLRFSKDSRTDHLFSVFLEDEIALGDRLRLTLGAKLEHNDYTGWETQPNARLLWSASEDHKFWTAVSRAVRSPTRAESDATVVAAVFPQAAAPPEFAPLLPFLPCPTCDVAVAPRGSQDFDTEVVSAYEVGYRGRPTETVAFDVAAYYNDYRDLRSVGIDPTNPGAAIGFDPVYNLNLISPTVGNKLDGTTWGVETAIDWYPLPWWRFRTGYTHMEIDLDPKSPEVGDPIALIQEGASPQNQAFLRSMTDILENLQFDTTLRYVDRLSSLDVDSYFTADLRLAWTPCEEWELSVVGQDLMDDDRYEFGSSSTTQATASRVPRSVYAKVQWRPDFGR